MDQDQIRLGDLDHLLQSGKRPGGDIKQGLAGLHDVEIVIRRHTEKLHDLVKHFPVLRRQGNLALKAVIRLQSLHQGQHFNGFRPGAEYG